MAENLNELNQGYQAHQLEQSLTAFAAGAAPAPAPASSAPPSSGGSTYSPAGSGSVGGAAAAGGSVGVFNGQYPNFATMSDEQIDEYVREHYPTYSWMLADPEVGPILRDAARHGTAAPEVESKIQNTTWYKTTSITARAWRELWATDPATATAKRTDKKTEIMALASNAGIPLDDSEALFIANSALETGMTDLALRQNIMDYARRKVATGAAPPASGSIATTAEQVKALAANYLMGITNDQAMKYAQDIWTGTASNETIQGNFAAMAQASWGSRDPGMADALNRGMTPRAYIDPQLQMVANTLQMSADQIDVLDPKWSEIINFDNGQGGKRIATVPEAELIARQQHEFRFTDQANDNADRRIATLLNTMGERKF